MEREHGLPKDYIRLGITLSQASDRKGDILREIEYKDGPNPTLDDPPLPCLRGRQQTEHTEVQMEETQGAVKSPQSFCDGLIRDILRRIHSADDPPHVTRHAVERDGGICWMVVAASFLSYFLFAGTRSSMGIVIEELEKTMAEASSELAWAGSLVNALPLLLGNHSICY
jgi:hypothetical protein